MNECLLVDMMGELSPEMLSEDTIENDLNEKTALSNRTKKIVFGVTAGSILATAGILLAVKLRKSNFNFQIAGK